MRAASLLCLAQAVLTSASALPGPNPGTYSGCGDPLVQFIDRALLQIPAPASKVCSSILHRTNCPTTTTTTTTTTFTVQSASTATVTSGTATRTSTSGLATTTTTTTATIVTILTSVATETTTTVTTTTNIATSTTTSVSTVTETTTSITSSTTFAHVLAPSPGVAKRAVQGDDTVGKAYPGCPKPLSAVALSVATKVCSCFLPPVTTKTSTVKATTTTTTTSTVTVPTTTVVVVPSSTTTVIETTTLVSSGSTTSTVTITETSTSTVMTTTIATSTSKTTTTTTATATNTATTTVTYVRQHEKSGYAACTYNRYTKGFEVSNNYPSQGSNDCASICDSRADCQFFFYLRFDPDHARGANNGYCYIDNRPYDSTLLQCGYVTLYSVGYNKGTSITIP